MRHHHWEPVTPVSAMVVGCLVLRLPNAVDLAIIVLVWSTLTHARLGFNRARMFSLVAVAIRELIDASAHRLAMRVWRSRGPHGLPLTIITATCPVVAGLLATRLLVPASMMALTALTWLPFVVFITLIERPWDTLLGYDAFQECIHQPQPIPLEHATADFRDTRKYLPELRRTAWAHAVL